MLIITEEKRFFHSCEHDNDDTKTMVSLLAFKALNNDLNTLFCTAIKWHIAWNRGTWAREIATMCAPFFSKNIFADIKKSEASWGLMEVEAIVLKNNLQTFFCAKWIWSNLWSRKFDFEGWLEFFKYLMPWNLFIDCEGTITLES